MMTMAAGQGTAAWHPPPATAPSNRVPYDDWVKSLDSNWVQGEHVTLIGPTGANKTTTAVEHLLPRRGFVIAFVTKRKDPVLWQLAGDGYDVFRDWKDVPAEVSRRIVLAPPTRGVHDLSGQQETFRNALAAAFRQGGWTIYLDETRYITDFLGLKRDVELLWHQGRSEGTTVVACAQRPRHLPLLAYSQASHHIYWRTGDTQDLNRIGEFGGANKDEVIRQVGDLRWDALGDRRVRAELLHLQTRDGSMVRALPPVK
jgi:hypothetical protein